ncbi:MAG TPA: serine hydrolase [Steroidobacteraceae bacterium]|nr:serine hydrolase [Steroidobacteraceae bacterium]
MSDGQRAAADGLARARPAEAGVQAHGLEGFLDALEADGIDLHSLVLHRNGRIALELYCWPYGPERPRVMHSVAKSFTACAIGMALAEGRFALTDKVADFFSDHLRGAPGGYLAAMTVEDLLTMRTGHDEETSGSRWRGLRSSWISEFFKISVVHRPGTVYRYTSAASYMLSAILTRTTGETLHNYLRTRLFEPLGISGETWDMGPDGVNPGGNGLSCKTIDVLKLGVLHAQKGLWHGRRLLPESWIERATRAHSPGGYGYHWMTGPERSFCAMGVFGQLLVVFPDHAATLALTSAVNGVNACTRTLLPLVHRHFPRIFSDCTGDQSAAEARLLDRSRRAAAAAPAACRAAPPDPPRGALEYRIDPNPLGISSLRLTFADQTCSLRLRGGDGEHAIEMGVGRWIESEAAIPAPELHHGYAMRPARVVACARWTDAATLEMIWIFVESAFRDTVTVRFEGDRIRYSRAVNVNSGPLSQPTLTGRRTGVPPARPANA